MSFSSTGLSFKNQGSPSRKSNSTSPHYDREDRADTEESCCYNKCFRKKYCNGYCIGGLFKSKFDAAICGLVTIMLTCLMFAVIVPIVLNSIIDSSINSEVVIDGTNAANYEAWQTNINGPGADVQIGYDLYFFDVQNADEILEGAKPVVVEVGPYAFNEFYYKFNIEWSDGGDTVTYNTQRFYIFNAGRTGPGLSEFDELTLPYPTVLGFQYLLSKIPYNTSVLVESYILNKTTEAFNNLEAGLEMLDAAVLANPSAQALVLHRKIITLEAEIQGFYDSIVQFIYESSPTMLLLKSLLCNVGSGVSPFWKTSIVPAYFGWFNDPVLLEVQTILNLLQMKTGTYVPWSTAVPGITNNYTSISETERRRGMDTMKTGKSNPKEVSQYVRYNNMTELWTCIAPMDSQNPADYVQGEQFPACAHYQYEWTAEEAEKMGYTRPFATPYANRIEGSDANMFGRPVTSEKLQVFIGDIYRSCYLIHESDEDWYSVPVRRYTIQPKDLLNATLYPENAQYYNFDAPSGMENLTAASGVPSWASFPHFLYGDPSLVAAVTGIEPSEAEHASYLDVEPQTGLLVRAEKKLQLNYQLTTQIFPTAPNTTAETLYDICLSYDSLLVSLEEAGIQTNLTALPCGNAFVQNLVTCISTESDWILQDNQIFLPYSWVREHFVLPESDADDLNETLFALQSFAGALQFWCLVLGGGFFCVICAALFTKLYILQDMSKKQIDNDSEISGYSYHPPLLADEKGLDGSSTSIQNPIGRKPSGSEVVMKGEA